MRNKNVFLKVPRLLFFFLILIQFHCLLNPIVREILDLDLSRKNDKLRDMGFLLSLLTGTGPRATITPSVGNIILSNAQILVVFNRSMNPSSVSASLGTQLTQIWSDTNSTNDTVTLSGSIPTGTLPFLLDASDSLGLRMTTVTGSYTVLTSNTNLYYVSTNGNDGNMGTSIGSPKLTIASAVTGATAPAAILVSAGDYFITKPAMPSIVLTETVSLYGGLSTDFLNRNPSQYITMVATIDSNFITDTYTMIAGASITPNTVVDGFTIRAPSNPNASGMSMAISCSSGSPTITNNRLEGGAVNLAMSAAILVSASSPLIANNLIMGGTSATSSSFGIFIQNISAPIIVSNTIQGGNAPVASAHGIYNAPQVNTPSIIGNTFFGGTGMISYALNTSPPSNPTVTNNSMDGGAGITSRAVYFPGGVGNLGNYQNNTLFTTGGTNRYCVYEAGGTNPFIFNGNRLFDCPTALYFDEGTTAITDIGTVNGGTVNGSTYSGNF
ncbi:hypothetical protein LEP1GSC199_1460 [Leptospira vanthielii serovar Holland str. Waz Holland = ATCC 700522]|uniref:PF07602 family protein n=1 Tax=Leptospira vanthielii serovar Holland str. Waz Holland = ATCC 700522 TaxID=1218591 RepID=N1W5F6_9LEPT|nr:hypothetical protein LEP1GSC199_1460 [Leptospira vanthielii serovar Holland str. Waz Holland = ATCC 700522]